MKRFFLFLIILVLFVAALLTFDYLSNYEIDWFGETIDNKLNSYILAWQTKNSTIAIVRINNKVIRAEVADTVAKQTIGLGGREGLGERDGMIFMFRKPDFYSFWMKGMKFPLDMIWINENVIVDITPNVPVPKGSLYTPYQPGEPANMVLEVNAGWADSNGVKIGDKLEVKRF